MATLDTVYSLSRHELHQKIKYIHGRAGKPVNLGEQLFLSILNVITNMGGKGKCWGGIQACGHGDYQLFRHSKCVRFLSWFGKV